MNQTSRDHAIAALRRSFRNCSPGITCDEVGYVPRLEDNLIGDVSREFFAHDYCRGGQELRGRRPKMHAIHSSSALAVNSFALWRTDPSRMRFADFDGFDELCFELECSTGLSGKGAHLDVFMQGRRVGAVGVESKLIEYLGRITNTFSDAYLRIQDARSREPWFGEIAAIRADPRRYRRLHAAQLIKHALGLLDRFQMTPVTLAYLYWEPTNAAQVDICREHRGEIARFAKVFGGSRVRFISQSYADLWRDWANPPGPLWLRDQVGLLEARYLVAM